jgi:hypothetical protein
VNNAAGGGEGGALAPAIGAQAGGAIGAGGELARGDSRRAIDATRAYKESKNESPHTDESAGRKG